MTILRREYAAVQSLIHRSVQDKNFRKIYSSDFHTTSSKSQDPHKQDQPNGGKPDGEDDKDKISTLLAKAFLWMLTAYMFIAIISLMFPSSNQPEVSILCIVHTLQNTLLFR